MGHLDKLDVSRRVIPAARPRHRTETGDYRRQKVIANVEEQIELGQLVIQGKPPELYRKRGHGVVKVRPRIWWRVDKDGHTATEIRYNKVALNIGGRGTTVEVGPLKRLPTVYRTVIRAIKAGELDQHIDAARRRAR